MNACKLLWCVYDTLGLETLKAWRDEGEKKHRVVVAGSVAKIMCDREDICKTPMYSNYSTTGRPRGQIVSSQGIDKGETNFIHCGLNISKPKAKVDDRST